MPINAVKAAGYRFVAPNALCDVTSQGFSTCSLPEAVGFPRGTVWCLGATPKSIQENQIYGRVYAESGCFKSLSLSFLFTLKMTVVHKHACSSFRLYIGICCFQQLYVTTITLSFLFVLEDSKWQKGFIPAKELGYFLTAINCVALYEVF